MNIGSMVCETYHAPLNRISIFGMYMKQGLVLCWLLLVLLWATLSGCGRFYVVSRDEVRVGVTLADDEAGAPAGRSIVADCVVTFYAADGGMYLSEQRHTIYPWSQAIEISANEPQGRFRWKLSGGEFRVVTGAAKVDELPIGIYDRNIAKLILTSVVASSGMSAELSESSEPAKVQGRWYSVIQIGPGSTYPKTLKNIEVPWAKITLYGNSNSGVIDRVVIEDVASGLRLMAHSYNFWLLKEIGKSIPTKIDVFKIDGAGIKQQRILSCAYHTVGLK